MRAGVGEKVADGLLKAVGVTEDGDGLFGQVEKPVVGRARGASVVRGVEDQQGQVDLFVFERAAGI